MTAVTVVCHSETLEQISAYTTSLSFNNNMTIKVDAPSSVEDNLGSADVLRLLSDTITVRPRLLPCFVVVLQIYVIVVERFYCVVLRFIYLFTTSGISFVS